MELEKTIVNYKQGFGIVLSGGGSGGAYEAGVIKALKEAGINFKLAAGTSVGALNAYLVAADRIDRIIDIWENLNTKKVFNFSPINLIHGYLLNNSPLEKLLREEVNEEDAKKIIDGKVKLMIISSDLRDRKEIIDEYFQDYTQIIKSLISSTAIPVAFPSRELISEMKKDKSMGQLVDGGLTENFPLDDSVKRGLCKTFFTTSLFIPDDETWYSHNLLSIGIRAIETIFTSSYIKEMATVKEKIKLANSLKEILGRKVNSRKIHTEKNKKIKALYEEYKIYEGVQIIEINPHKRLALEESMNFYEDRSKKIIEMGYKDARDRLRSVEII